MNYEEYFFIAKMSNAEWAALSVSSVIWLVVNTAGIKKNCAVFMEGRKCSFGNDKVTDFRSNESERGSWFSAPYLDQLWSSTITECVMGAFSLRREQEVMKAS